MAAAAIHRWLPQFSLRQLLLATTFVAVGCYALRWASPWWSLVLFYTALAGVIGGLLVAINWPGESRSFWSGFAVCGIATGCSFSIQGSTAAFQPISQECS